MFDDFDGGSELDEILDQVPGGLRSGLPKVSIRYEGKKTILQNYGRLLKEFNRKQRHVSSFLSEKLGAKTKRNDQLLIIFAKISPDKIKIILQTYLDRFILCPNCGKPDTILHGQQKGTYDLKCLACGVISQVNN